MKKKNNPWTIEDLEKNISLIEFPEYQREPIVWGLVKKQKLIDSILRDFDIAPIYLFKKNDGSYDCIDGRQRLNAIFSYLGKNETDSEDNGFHLKMTNEIFDDAGKYRDADNKRFSSLSKERQDKIKKYRINVVEIDEVENEEELNLQFLRLQLGSILNAGEKLHAMTGEMRNYIFNDIGHHDYFKEINIPYRRYAREQVAAQIVLNFFSKKATGEYHSSRYEDLQEFFKGHVVFSETDKKYIKEIGHILNEITKQFKDNLKIIKSRAIAVSVFMMISEMIEQKKDEKIKNFVKFFVMFMKALKWQVSKGIDIDRQYQELLKFQTHVTQAAGEKYSIQRRHDFWNSYFYYFEKETCIKGDKELKRDTGRDAEKERTDITLE